MGLIGGSITRTVAKTIVPILSPLRLDIVFHCCKLLGWNTWVDRCSYQASRVIHHSGDGTFKVITYSRKHSDRLLFQAVAANLQGSASICEFSTFTPRELSTDS